MKHKPYETSIYFNAVINH